MRSGGEGRGRPRRRGLRWRCGAAVLPLLASALAARGSSVSSGPADLNWYHFPDDSGALQQAADSCSRASGGRYTVHYNKLPRTADGQRQQLVRRLAAHDSAMDILGLDVTWAAEIAEAGWAREWTGPMKDRATRDTLAVPLRTATWQGRLYGGPYNANTQLLWYRDDLAPSPPKTRAEMLAAADALAGLTSGAVKG